MPGHADRGKFILRLHFNQQIKSGFIYRCDKNLQQRIIEHYVDRTEKKSFAGKYNCHYLIFYEEFQYINDAISKEKEIKGWKRSRKEILIEKFNPGWKFLNEEIFGVWPPNDVYHRKDN